MTGDNMKRPTVPRLSFDLVGFIAYINAVNDYHSQAAMERFRAIVLQQEKKHGKTERL